MMGCWWQDATLRGGPPALWCDSAADRVEELMRQLCRQYRILPMRPLVVRALAEGYRGHNPMLRMVAEARPDIIRAFEAEAGRAPRPVDLKYGMRFGHHQCRNRKPSWAG